MSGTSISLMKVLKKRNRFSVQLSWAKPSKENGGGAKVSVVLSGSQSTLWRGEKHRSQLIAAVPPVQMKKLGGCRVCLCAPFTDWLLVPGLYSLFNSASSEEPFHLLLQEE